jgi:hypothetical protein
LDGIPVYRRDGFIGVFETVCHRRGKIHFKFLISGLYRKNTVQTVLFRQAIRHRPGTRRDHVCIEQFLKDPVNTVDDPSLTFEDLTGTPRGVIRHKNI